MKQNPQLECYSYRDLKHKYDETVTKITIKLGRPVRLSVQYVEPEHSAANFLTVDVSAQPFHRDNVQRTSISSNTSILKNSKAVGDAYARC